MYRTRYISLGLVDVMVTVTLVAAVDPRGLSIPRGLPSELREGGVNIKLVGIKFRPRPPERSGAGGGH